MPRSPLVLAYHGVADVRLRADRYALFTAPADLRRHIRALRRWGFRFTTFGDLVARTRAGDGQGLVALTFDDGLADNCTTLLPLLQAEGVPATVFVATAFVGGRHPDVPDAPMLTAEGLCALAAAGIEIGGHSHAHQDLTTLSFDAARDDLRQSREILASILDRPVTVAAYPFGAADEHTRRACREAGFEAAARTHGEGSWDDPFDIPRQDMNSYSGLLGLRLKRHGLYEPIVRTSLGRAARSLGRRAKSVAR